MIVPALEPRRPAVHVRHATSDLDPAPRRVRPGPRSVPQQPPADPLPVVARYRYRPDRDAWWWSPEMFTLSGLPRDTTTPCTQLLLDALHPDDRPRAARAIERACADGRPFSLEARIARPEGTLRTVVLIGEPTGTGLDGVCADVGDGPERQRLRELETEVAQLKTAMASRACIEQAKGILMLLTSCGEQMAFELLAHISSHAHRKVRDVAAEIVESAAGRHGLSADICAIVRDACPPPPPPT